MDGTSVANLYNLAVCSTKIGIVRSNLCTKYELDIPPNNEVMKMHPCCHGNKISLATRNKGSY